MPPIRKSAIDPLILDVLKAAEQSGIPGLSVAQLLDSVNATKGGDPFHKQSLQDRLRALVKVGTVYRYYRWWQAYQLGPDGTQKPYPARAYYYFASPSRDPRDVSGEPVFVGNDTQSIDDPIEETL